VNEPGTHVVIRLSALGDVVLTTGVIEYWREKMGLSFTFITRGSFVPVLVNNPAVTRIIGLTEDELSGRAWLVTAKKLAIEYKTRTLVDLHGSLRSQILRTFWKGDKRSYPKFSLSRRVYGRWGLASAREKLESLNVPQRYSLTLEDCAPEPEKLRPRIRLDEDELSVAEQTLAALGITGPCVALHPFATHPTKAWPAENWQRLIELLENSGVKYFIIGSGNTPLLPGNGLDFTNQTTIRQTCALLAGADVLVTNDSGPMHLATAVGTPVTGIFGPTTRAWGFYPSGPDDVVLEADLACRPCSLHGRKTCPHDLACLRAVTPDMVIQTIIPIIEKGGRS